jgi:hypothetical protein
MDQIQFSVDRSRSNWSAFFGGGGDAFSSAWPSEENPFWGRFDEKNEYEDNIYRKKPF